AGALRAVDERSARAARGAVSQVRARPLRGPHPPALRRASARPVRAARQEGAPMTRRLGSVAGLGALLATRTLLAEPGPADAGVPAAAPLGTSASSACVEHIPEGKARPAM